jgi:protein TonB
MSAIVHTFPSFHNLNARGVFLAVIVALHAAFLWGLSSGLTREVLIKLPHVAKIIDVPLQQPDESVPPPEPVEIERHNVVSAIPKPVLEMATESPRAIELPVHDAVNTQPLDDSGSGPAADPVLVEPRIDARWPLAEPVYPPQEIRLNHAGTVRVAVQVLADGSIGDVRIEQSSGYRRLDEAAVRAARQWKLRPGTRDGVATPMWKVIPVTFQVR